MTKLTLKAEERKVTGRKVKKLRREGLLPANIYGKDVKSQSIQVVSAEFEKIYKEAGETNLVEIMVGSTNKPTLIHEIQTDPVTDLPVHVDFLQVNLKEKVTANVPVELIGESPAVKQGLGTLVQQIEEIEVEALPTDLPDKFEIDVSVLVEVDSSLSIGDLKVDEKKIAIEADKELIIVKIEPLREEEVEVAPAAEGEGVAGEVKEGEKPAEGESKDDKATEDNK